MRLVYTLILVLGSVFSTFAQQVTLFNQKGDPIAYIDYKEDKTIYMWDGTPVAYLENEGKDICIYGFKRLFLGWYEEGIIYDREGLIVGSRRDAISTIKYTFFEPFKPIQRISPIRSIPPLAPIKPILKTYWSTVGLEEFLVLGKKE